MAEAAVDLKKYDRSILKDRKRHYETIFVMNPSLDDKTITTTVEKLKKVLDETNAALLRADDWGKKKLAYEMDKHQQGRYFYFRYISNVDSVNGLERLAKLDTSILRYQTVRLSGILSDQEVKELTEKAPDEPSVAPPQQNDDFDFVRTF